MDQVKYYGLMDVATRHMVPHAAGGKKVWGSTGLEPENPKRCPPKLYRTPRQAELARIAWLKGMHCPGRPEARQMVRNYENSYGPFNCSPVDLTVVFEMVEEAKGTTVLEVKSRKDKEIHVVPVHIILGEAGGYFAGRTPDGKYIPVAYPKHGGTSVDPHAADVVPPRLFPAEKNLKCFLHAYCAGTWYNDEDGALDFGKVKGRPTYAEMTIVPVALSC